ncbi:MAG: DUF1631 family protein, partial [Betaproteobacteria bacterium]
MFHASVCDVARLSIETSGDLFEMDGAVPPEAILAFRSHRKDWRRVFDASLRHLYEHRIGGNRRKRRRPDSEESLRTLRILTDADAQKQSILGALTKQLAAAAQQELDALDLRFSALLDERPGAEIDNPFSTAYLLDAIGMTSRSLYPDPRIWRSVMQRVITDFIPAIAKIYIPLNRLLAERGVLPDAGALVRARSQLYPRDDAQVMPLFHRLINDIHPSLQAWRTLDVQAARAARYPLLPLAANPYMAALGAPSNEPAVAPDPDGFPRLDAMMPHRELHPILETLDRWQRDDPMAAHLRTSAPDGIDASVTPVNRIPWIQAALGPQVKNAHERNTIDVVGFLFDYVVRDISIPPRLRLIFDGLQVPILKIALADPAFFAGRRHPARRLLNELAEAAIGGDDDGTYGAAITRTAARIVDMVRREFGIDSRVFDNACAALAEFTERERVEVTVAIQPQVDKVLADESRDVDRAQVRMLVRNRLAGADLPFDVRAFACTVWASYLKQVRQTDGPDSTAFVAATQTLDDLLWSITLKPRSGQKSRLSRLIPTLIGRLREGAAAVQVTGEKMKRFLDALYALHLAAIRPEVVAEQAESLLAANDPPKNVYDLVLDAAKGTWFAFDRGGGRWTHARLDWISPMRTTYVLTGRTRNDTTLVVPEDLAWEIERGRASLVAEPVPLYDRAISAALDFLAARGDTHAAAQTEARAESAPAGVPRASLATA